MHKKLIGLIAATVLCIGGCATAYQSEGFSGGFSELQMAQDVYQIKYSGNAFTSSSQTGEMAMLRAAELTLKSGYSHFVILGDADSSSKSYLYSPGTTRTQIQPNGIGGYNAYSNTSGNYLSEINKPRSNMTIKMFHDDSQGGMPAQEIYDRLATKYIHN